MGSTLKCVDLAILVALICIASVMCGKNRHDEISDSDQLKALNQEEWISISPNKKSLNTGKDTQFQCTAYNKTAVYWLNVNGSRIQDLNDTRFEEKDGWLNITKLTLMDKGDYTCLTEDHVYNATVHLDVYEMPDYFLASMIVVAINVALAILFFSCLVYKTIQSRREANRYKKYKNTGVEITINDDKPNKPHNKHLDI